MHVVIVGGGIVGCASAYYLRQRGADVTVVERDTIGSGSTPRAGGGIREQFTTPESIGLSRTGIEVWSEFESSFGANLEYRRPGYLYLARDEETAQTIRETVELHDEYDVPSKYITPHVAAEHCPGLDPEQYVGGSYCPTDGYASTARALQGFALAAARDGARFRVGRRVTAIDRTDGGYRVRTDGGALDTDYVVNAAGGWAGNVAAMVDVDLDVTPSRRQLAIVELDDSFDESLPFVTDLDSGSYFRRHDDETALVGGHFTDEGAADPDRFHRDYTRDWAETALREAGDVTDRFDDARIRRGWAGLYAVTPDHHPVIEETVPGFVNAVGFSGHGFMQSPATGKLVSELVVDGEASLLDISRLTSDRFERGETLRETFYSA